MSKKLNFGIMFDYKQYARESINLVGRRVGPFIDTMQGDVRTFTVDFNLGGGYFNGWTLWDMTGAGDEAISTLMWVMDKDFPDEVKHCITRHLKDRGIIRNDDGKQRRKRTASSDSGTKRIRKDRAT